MEAAATDALTGDDREEAFHGIEPRSGGRREMEGPARMAFEPCLDLRMLMRGVVVDDGFDQLASWHGTLDVVEEADELLVAVLLHAAADHRAVEHVEGSKQCRRAVTLVIVGHGAATAGFECQAGLRAVERLNLALLIDREHHCMRRRIDIQADNVGHLSGEIRVARSFERADPMRLEVERLPDALDRPQGYAGGFGHRPARPMRRRMWRLSAGHRYHVRHQLSGDRRLARLAGLVTQQAVHAFLGEALLPAPYHRAAQTELRGDALHSVAGCRCEHDTRSLRMLPRPIAIRRDCHQPFPIRRAHDYSDSLCHLTRLARPAIIVNRQNASEH